MQHPPNHPCKGFSLNLSSMTHEPLLPPWVAYPRDWTSSRSPKRSPPSRHELMSAGPGFFCWRKSFLRCIVKIPKNEKEMTWHWIIDAFFFSKKKKNTSVGNMTWCIHLKKKSDELRLGSHEFIRLDLGIHISYSAQSPQRVSATWSQLRLLRVKFHISRFLPGEDCLLATYAWSEGNRDTTNHAKHQLWITVIRNDSESSAKDQVGSSFCSKSEQLSKPLRHVQTLNSVERINTIKHHEQIWSTSHQHKTHVPPYSQNLSKPYLKGYILHHLAKPKENRMRKKKS